MRERHLDGELVRRLFCSGIIGAICGWTVFAPHAVFGAPSDLGCIKDLMVPRYNLYARRSATGGTVKAIVTIGSSTKPAKIELQATDQDLAEEVRAYLTRETTYSEACEGKLVELLFTFRLEGEAEWDPPVFVRFQPPNHFIIISRPKKPNIN